VVDALLSSAVATRDATGCPPEVRPYTSLRGRSAFAEVYRRGTRRRIGDIVVFVAGGRPGAPEVGFVAGKNVGNAVARNRAKRRLREAAARTRFPDGTAWIVVARPGVNEAPFAALVRWMAEAARSGSVPGSSALLEQEIQ
jgi:ribonuclease P protein component